MLKIAPKFWVSIASLSLMSLSSIGMAAECGPGEHWVDNCPSGVDEIKNHWAVMKLEITDPGGNPVIIPIESLQGSPQFQVYRGDPETGPVTITPPPVPTDPPTPSEFAPEVFGPIEPPADPPAPHDPHRGVIQTEIISLNFAGETTLWGEVAIRAGDGIGNLANDGPLYSPGVIYETLTDSTKACSVFFVTYEMAIKETGELLYGQGRMATCDEEEKEVQDFVAIPPEKLEYKDPRKRPIRNKKGEIIGYVFHKHPIPPIKPLPPFPPPPQGCRCGPGINWVEDCPEARDVEFSQGFVTVEIPCGGASFTIPLSGTTMIDNSAWDGTQIDLDMYSMVLKDPTKQYTIIAGSKHGLNSPGIVTPTPNPWVANINFDILFKIQTPQGWWHNKPEGPHKMGTLAYCLPPLWDEHIPPTNAPPTLLYDEQDNVVACIVGAAHILDVKLDGSLEAKVVDNTVKLTWKTTQERDVLGFEIKRKNGSGEICRSTLGYESVSGILPSEGEGSSYTFDDAPGTGNYCYMLVEVNDSGNSVSVAPEQQADFITPVTIN